MQSLAHGIIHASFSVLDYGCGRGEDVKYLQSAGISASGWDPHYKPETILAPADIVNLGYVLNVIEDPHEREETLRRAFDLANRALVVAVRVEQGLEIGVEFSDGFLTSRRSFQKLYKQKEFKEYLKFALSCRPHMVGLGIAYIFKDEQLESEYLARLSQRRFEASPPRLIEQFSQDPHAQQYIRLAGTLGRSPLPSEFVGYHELLDRFGSPQRVERLTQQLLSPEALQESQNRRRDDILTYIAMMKLQGIQPPPLRSLPTEIRADIKTLWPSYSRALQEGDSFLFQIGKPESVRDACNNNPVGKKLPDALYLHRSSEEQVGPLLRVLIFAGRQIVGEIDHNVLKISTDGRSISLLQYDAFDQTAHPELLYSLRVYLPRAEYSIRDYSKSDNPPILHRKETLVDPLYPNYSIFADLTTQEEQLGLLSRSDIGTKQKWLAALAERKMAIEGHTLSSIQGDPMEGCCQV